ncbi:MAG: hypothetical protein Q8942_13110, partial [Bacillota bacterium]|nr:hypothetical protein [Bacillota bacterium]
IYSNKFDGNLNIIVKRTISGKVSLPNGEKATGDGISIELTASVNSQNEIKNEVKKTVKILPGDSSVDYSMKVLPNDPGIGYVVRFQTSFDYGYVMSGYFNTNGFVRNPVNTKTIDVSSGDYNGTDFGLKKFKAISGKVILNGGTATGDDIRVNVFAKNKADRASTTVVIPKDKNYGEYTLYLPENDENDGYLVSYENWTYDNYLSTGFFSNIGTVRYESLADKIDFRNSNTDNKTDIDLNVVMKKTISGTISLPNSEKAPTGGLNVTITAKNANDFGITSVFIPEGSDHIGYTINVPAGSNYQLFYGLPIINDYVTKGYYANGSMSYRPVESNLDLSSSGMPGIDGINLTLIKKRLITGYVSLPNGKNAEEDTIVTVTAENAGNTTVKIPVGVNSAPFTIKAEPNVDGKGCKVGYEISTSYGYVATEYYSKNGMVRNSKLADDINANDVDVSDIGISLVLPKKINGKVSLPNGILADKDITMKVSGSNGIDGDSTTVVIAAGTNSATYSLSLPPNDRGFEYTVKYENWNEFKYTLYGYYNSRGTTAILSQSDGVDISIEDAGSVDLTLVVRRTIKGNIIIPDQVTIPKEGLSVKVIAESGLESYETSIVLASDTKTCPYTLYVEPNSGYKIRYNIKNNSIFMEDGYYNPDGTTTDINNATNVEVSNGEVTNKNLTLIVKRIISGSVTLPDSVLSPTAEEYMLKNTSYTSYEDYLLSGNVSSEFEAAYLKFLKGFEVKITATNGKDMYPVSVSILPGQRTADFQISVPAKNGYRIQYEIDSNPDIAPIGYYTTKSSIAVRDIKDADVFDLTTAGLSNVNFKMLQNRTISGKIKLPLGTAPADGIKVVITASDISGTSISKDFYISAGDKSVDYSMSVIPLQAYKIKYNVELQGYSGFGYYSSKGMVMLPELAQTINVFANDAEDIDITLIEKKQISGNVSLPSGVVSSKDIPVKVKVINAKTGTIDVDETTIIKGSTSAPYNVKVTPDVNNNLYKVIYEVEPGNGVFESGYYNSVVTVPDEKLASTIDLTFGSISGANI